MPARGIARRILLWVVVVMMAGASQGCSPATAPTAAPAGQAPAVQPGSGQPGPSQPGPSQPGAAQPGPGSPKKGVLVVSFGTSYPDVIKSCIESTEDAIRAAFPDREVRRAFTSGMIIKKLQERDNLVIESPGEALQRMEREGFTDVVVQPLHIIPGSEYDEVRAVVEQSRAAKFDRLVLGHPLLWGVDDYREAVAALKTQLPALSKTQAVILMGHGSPHPANSAYACLQQMIADEGLPVYVATVEGYPVLDDVIPKLRARGVREVILMPFMLVAGDHALNDMAGDGEDSWKTILRKQGFTVTPYLEGLGENPAFRELFARRARQAAEGAPAAGAAQAPIQVVDDPGRTITLAAPARRVISLYSAHTENLFTLGAGDRLIGVSRSEALPEALAKPAFDYRSDPEKVVAAGPDLVLIRPHIANAVPDFVRALEKAGIPVVSLYPETFEEFERYIEKLAKLVGAEDAAGRALEQFHRDLDDIKRAVQGAQPRVRVFFESTGRDYRTVASNAMPARAIELAGGVNVAADVGPVRGGTSIAAFGAERLLARADEIDVYVAQSGVMNPGVTAESIAARPGFSAIKAVREGRVYVIDEKLVSSPTFRFVEGVRALARMFYPGAATGSSQGPR